MYIDILCTIYLSKIIRCTEGSLPVGWSWHQR